MTNQTRHSTRRARLVNMAAVLLLLASSMGTQAQSATSVGPDSRAERRAEREAREMVWEGNRLFDEGEYAEAEIFYRKAREGSAAVGADFVGENADRFNLGAAVYEQDRYEEAVQQWSRVAGNENLSKETRSRAAYNQGNALYQQEQYEPALDAFKQSLRLDPGNADARHNLAMTRRKIQEQQEQEQQNQDQNQDQQDQEQNQDQQNEDGEQDQENQEQNQDQQGEGEQDDQQDQSQQDGQQDQQGEGQEEQRPDGQPRSLSPEELERILDALEQDERDVQQKINAQKKPAAAGKAEKDW